MLASLLPLLTGVTPPPLAQVTCGGLEAAYLSDPPCCDGGGSAKHIAQSEQGERVEAYFDGQKTATKVLWDGDTSVLLEKRYWDESGKTVRVDVPISSLADLFDVASSDTVYAAWVDDSTPHLLVFAHPSTTVETSIDGVAYEQYITIIRI